MLAAIDSIGLAMVDAVCEGGVTTLIQIPLVARQPQNRFDYALDRDAGHAPEIDGTRAAEARGARRLPAQQFMSASHRPSRASQFRRRTAERNNDGGANGGGQVHWPRIVCEHDMAAFQCGAEFPKGGLSG